MGYIMKFEVERDQLLKSITIADSIITSKNVNTILSNCLFNVGNNVIEILSTDNEIGIRTGFEAVSDDSFSFTVNGKRFAGILKEFPRGIVTVILNENYSVNIKMKGLQGNYSLVGLPRGDFPDLPEFNEKKSFEFDQAILKDVFRKVVYAASTDSIKPSFCGVYFISEEKGSISAVATDSKRLSLVKTKINSEIMIEDGVIIPLKTVHEVSRLLGNNGSCSLIIGDNQCFFRIGNTEIVSRLIDGQFPNYKQVIPKEHKTIVTVKKAKLAEAIKRVIIFTREPSYKALINFNKGVLKIETKSSELGEAEEEIPVLLNGDDSFTVGISAQFLFDSIREIDTDDVDIFITSNISPLIISPHGNRLETSVIMPIQLRSGNDE